MRLIHDSVEQMQAAEEAIEVLRRTGFVVSDFSIDTDPESAHFSVDLRLALDELERPLENVA